jgi:two-component system, NarL family, response regulator LiaR
MNTPKQIRVLIVDDHPMLRRGIATFLKAFTDLEMAGEAESGEEAIKMCAKLQPDVVLMDLVMPGMGGEAAIKLIHEKYPDIEIIALTSFTEEEHVVKALTAGAISYLLKDVAADELAQAIRFAYAGKTILSPDVTNALVRAANQPAPIDYDLTDREREVLGLMIEGLNNSQISERLVVSLSTVKSHVSNVLSKLAVASRTEAVTLALKNHILP